MERSRSGEVKVRVNLSTVGFSMNDCLMYMGHVAIPSSLTLYHKSVNLTGM